MTTVTYYRVAGDTTVSAPANVHKICIHCEDETFFLMTEEQYTNWQVNKQFVQDVFPHLDKETKEWMISGTHPACWNQIFGDEHEEDLY